MLYSKLSSAVLLRRGRKTQEGDFGNEKKNTVCQHGLPLKWSRDHFHKAICTQPSLCWRREDFAGGSANFLCQLPLGAKNFPGLASLTCIDVSARGACLAVVAPRPLMQLWSHCSETVTDRPVKESSVNTNLLLYSL